MIAPVVANVGPFEELSLKPNPGEVRSSPTCRTDCARFDFSEVLGGFITCSPSSSAHSPGGGGFHSVPVPFV